jgi:hypothetical protein
MRAVLTRSELGVAPLVAIQLPALLRDALSCASASSPGTEVEVVAATQKIDVYAVPDPTRVAEREKMGLLGELFVAPSLFEPFRNTPNLPPIRRLLCKQLT